MSEEGSMGNYGHFGMMVIGTALSAALCAAIYRKLAPAITELYRKKVKANVNKGGNLALDKARNPSRNPTTCDARKANVKKCGNGVLGKATEIEAPSGIEPQGEDTKIEANVARAELYGKKVMLSRNPITSDVEKANKCGNVVLDKARNPNISDVRKANVNKCGNVALDKATGIEAPSGFEPQGENAKILDEAAAIKVLSRFVAQGEISVSEYRCAQIDVASASVSKAMKKLYSERRRRLTGKESIQEPELQKKDNQKKARAAGPRKSVRRT